MRRSYLKDESLARGKKICIGIDVRKESWQVTASSKGKISFMGEYLRTIGR